MLLNSVYPPLVCTDNKTSTKKWPHTLHRSFTFVACVSIQTYAKYTLALINGEKKKVATSVCILLSVQMTMLIVYRFLRVGSAFTKIAEVHPVFSRHADLHIVLKTGCAEPEIITQPYIVH